MSHERYGPYELGTPNVYIARKSCGCSVGLVVNILGDEKETGKTVAEWIGRGHSIEQHSLASSREQLNLPFGCACNKQLSLGESA